MTMKTEREGKELGSLKSGPQMIQCQVSCEMGVHVQQGLTIDIFQTFWQTDISFVGGWNMG